MNVRSEHHRPRSSSEDPTLLHSVTNARQAFRAPARRPPGGAAPKTSARRVVLAMLCAAVGAVGASATLSPAAGAYATLEGPPQFSAAPGLPDGRFYEQVSPGDKFGNEAGGSTSLLSNGAQNHYGIASADGNAVLFEGTGAMGESASGNSRWFVATKKAREPGWSTRSLLPAERTGSLGSGLLRLDPSADLSHAMVETSFLLDDQRCPDMFLTGPNPFVAATWLGRPEIDNSVEGECNRGNLNVAPAGGTPDFSTVYFAYAGTLLPEDAERAPHAGGNEAWGFYEYQEGVLREAGVLPDGKLDPFGAVPAAADHGRNPRGNQVSADGSRAFFVSPDPGSCEAFGGHNDCVTDPPELYVRETEDEGAGAHHETVLVSQDGLLPQSGGLPAAAPGGVLQMSNPTVQGCDCDPDGLIGSYVFASPDGSQAFFQSASALTKAAEEASPGSEPKTYDFDVSTGALTYLPGVVLEEILATDRDGSSFAFVRPAIGGEPAQLELWSAGLGGGSVTGVARLPEPGATVPEAQFSNDGSILAFQTVSRVSGEFNSGTAEQVYRYDVPANTLGCVSCAPTGVTPAGASMSRLSSVETDNRYGVNYVSVEFIYSMVDDRGISADGDRIFFETSTPLVPQDSNTNSPPINCNETGKCPQGIDVYEWENGVVYLLSTGRSPLSSYLVDSSENGDDVFIATAEGLVPGDTDGGYDIYDARVPHPGEPFPPAAVPCEGAVCQGPPNVPSPLTPPASATFSGLGNPAPEVAVTAAGAKLKTVKCAKGRKPSHGKCVKVKSKKKTRKAGNDRRAKS